MYSQNKEESIITHYFRGPKSGTLLDIGANDGITLSNSYALIQAGWNAVCVEASPSAYERLVIRHWDKPGHQVQNIHAAVTDFNGEITLHESGEHLGKGDTSLLSTTKPSEMERWQKETFTEVTVPAINFETLLGLSRYKKFDFITMDCEACEKEVLPQMDLRALGCSLICVEYNGKDIQWYNAIILGQGLKLIHKNGENLIYGV